MARQRRDWPGAVHAFAEAARLDPPHPEYAQKAETARLYDRLAQRTWPEHGPRYAAYVVNLDRNAERMVELGRQFAGCPVPIHRQAAVEGSRLPAAAVRRLTGDAAAPRGTLGCFLSHAAAWEAMLARGDSHCLIVEDDVIPLLDLPATLGGLGLPDELDLCFVNDRIAPKTDPARRRRASPSGAARRGDGRLPPRGQRARRRRLHPEPRRRRASCWTGSARTGSRDDVDWRLLAYALTPDEIAGIPAPSHARPGWTALGARCRRPERLRAYVLHPPLIRTVGVSSDREDENRLHPG